MSILVNKFKHLSPVNDLPKIEEAWLQMVTMSKQEQAEYWHLDNLTGKVMLLPLQDSQTGENFYLEYVRCNDEVNDDSVTTLYSSASEMTNRAKWADVRKELIFAVAGQFNALPSGMTVFDEGRNREVFLSELGTAQLLDILARSSNIDIFSGARA